MSARGTAGQTLSDKLNRLFDSVRSPEGDEYTHDEVASALRAAGGPTISATYVWQLRKGLRDNPTKHHLEALADFFGVSPSYFFDEASAERIDAELDLLGAMRDASIRAVALRAVGLSPGSLAAIRTIVEQARRVEGLATDDADTAT